MKAMWQRANVWHGGFVNSGVEAVTVKLTGTRLIVSQAFASVSTFCYFLAWELAKPILQR